MEYDFLFEAYPDEIQARLEARARFLRNLPAGTGITDESVIETLKLWAPGQTLTVAFRGGDATLYAKIAETAVEWTKYGNIKLDFRDPATGAFRSWSPADTDYAAHIRVSFNLAGYWSLVGSDSNNPAVVSAGESSMNFGGFAISLPQDWAATVLHEFGHALGFQHEHQHPVGGCDLDFRWEDEPGYTPTVDGFGQFISDPNGKQPGLYTVLGGPPNRWPQWKVDHNLRQLTNSHAYMVSPFDPQSIMKYYFGAWMFRDGTQSHCFSQRNTTLSERDKAGIREAYPSSQEGLASAVNERKQLLGALMKEEKLQPEMKEALKIQYESLEEG